MGFDWLTPRIHKPLCSLLESPQENTRLLICLPRGWLKTTLCSQAYPLWRAINNPNIRVLLVQNTFTNAVAKLQVIKKQVEGNELLRVLFPEIIPTPECTWKGESLCLNRTKAFAESTFEAAGTGTKVTSRHYDLIIEDDTVAPDLNDLGEMNLAPTKEQVEQAIGYHRLITPLLNENHSKGQYGQCIVVGTRWFQKDLISWVRDNEPHYKGYFRACRENDEGKPDAKGHLTYPERFDVDVLRDLESSLGPYMFSCLYYNLPVRSEDMTFHPEWIRYFDTEPKSLLCYTTVDPAGDPEDSTGPSDFTAVVTCGKNIYTGLVYVLEVSRERCSPGRLLSLLFDHVKRWSPVIAGVESVQYQKSLLYWARERMRKENCYFLIEPIRNNRMSKNARIRGLQPMLAAGSLLFRPHMTELVKELLSFPLGEYDDVIDALSMQLELWASTTSVEQEKGKVWARDPMSVDCAIDELKEKNNAGKHFEHNLSMDLFGTAETFGMDPLTWMSDKKSSRRLMESPNVGLSASRYDSRLSGKAW